jgi:hypothetical protein
MALNPPACSHECMVLTLAALVEKKKQDIERSLQQFDPILQGPIAKDRFCDLARHVGDVGWTGEGIGSYADFKRKGVPEEVSLLVFMPNFSGIGNLGHVVVGYYKDNYYEFTDFQFDPHGEDLTSVVKEQYIDLVIEVSGKDWNASGSV